MTAVCYKDGILAVDSQSTYEGIIEYFDKLRVLKTKQDGFPKAAITGSGDHYNEKAWEQWWADGKKKKPDCNFDGYIIAMGKQKIVIITEDAVLEHDKKNGKYVPIFFGSGKHHIAAGLDMGLSAVECVKLACRLDDGCSGDILWVDRKEMKINRIKYSGGWEDDQ